MPKCNVYSSLFEVGPSVGSQEKATWKIELGKRRQSEWVSGPQPETSGKKRKERGNDPVELGMLELSRRLDFHRHLFTVCPTWVRRHACIDSYNLQSGRCQARGFRSDGQRRRSGVPQLGWTFIDIYGSQFFLAVLDHLDGPVQ